MQDGQARGEIIILPEIGLQQAGMIRQMIEDLGGHQTVIAQLQVECIHLQGTSKGWLRRNAVNLW